MAITRRIFISVPGDHVLNEAQRSMKWALVDKISELGFLPEMFHSERVRPASLTAGRGWTFAECASVMRRCVGAVIIGLPRHTLTTEDGPLRLPTEYAHFEGAVAMELKLPTLLLAEAQLADRGIFHWGGGHVITSFPHDADSSWLSSERFQNALSVFESQVRARRDVFLGYCSSSQGVAASIKLIIERVVGATVLDWKTDFIEGPTILEEIQAAAKRTSGGIFLFTRDDLMQGEEGKEEQAAPRDNVVFEAGYFAHAKGRERVLIIREAGAKMPADLGGSIYAALADRSNPSALEQRISRFIETAI